MRELLGERPVHRGKVRPGYRRRGLRDGEVDREIDVDRPWPRRSQVVRWRRCLRWGFPQERAKRVERHDPCRDRRRERLAEKRTEWLVLERLDVAGAPVVEKNATEDVAIGLVGIYWSRVDVAGTDDPADLQLDVELAGRPEL